MKTAHTIRRTSGSLKQLFILFSVFLCLVVLPLASQAQATKTTDVAPADDSTVSWLFVLTAFNGSFDGKTLTLHNVPPALMFSDRPHRLRGHMALSTLIASGSEGTNSFKENPPNAVLSTFPEGQPPTTTTVVLYEPTLKGTTLSFPIKILDEKGVIPTTFKGASLFIDHFCHSRGGPGGPGGGPGGPGGGPGGPGGGPGGPGGPGPGRPGPRPRPHCHWHPPVGALVVGAAVGSAAARASQPETVVVTQPTYVYTTTPTTTVVVDDSSLTLEQKLKKLKSMQQEGLITQAQYEQKAKEVLSEYQ